MIRVCINNILYALAFAALLAEEAFWAVGRWLGSLLARIPFWSGVEMAAAALPARAVAVVFLLPMGLLLPVKLFAVWLMGHHHVVAGATVIVVAKLGGTAISARLFAIARPKLMTLPWFAVSYGWVTRMLARAHAWVEGIPAWHRARLVMTGLRRRLRRILSSFRRGAVRKAA